MLFSPPTSHVSRRQPRKCQINASFIIDTRELAGPSDWKADDLGVFDNVGKVNIKILREEMLKWSMREIGGCHLS